MPPRLEEAINEYRNNVLAGDPPMLEALSRIKLMACNEHMGLNAAHCAGCGNDYCTNCQSSQHNNCLG